MSIIRHSSGNLNAVRVYPFADTASLAAINAARLPEFVLTDCHVWWPDTYGELAFVSALTVSPGLITATIAVTPRASVAITPIAVFHVARPHVPYRSYAMTALVPGAGGWAAFGDLSQLAAGVNTWLFDTPENAELLPRLAQAYAACPVRSVSKLNATTQLIGTIRLLTGANIEIVSAQRSIEGTTKSCIVFRLPESQLPDLYDRFAGPCGRRPETGTCDKQAIRTINGIAPDADGVIHLTLTSDGTISGSVENISGDAVGVALSTPVSFDDVCSTTNTFEPVYTDTCAPESDEGGGGGDGQSSSSVSGSSSSSETAEQLELAYDMDNVDTLNDWSVFTKNANVHALDWVVNNYEPDNADTAMTVYDSALHIPWSHTTTDDDERMLASNAVAATLDTVGQIASISSVYTLEAADIDGVATDEAAAFTHYVQFTTAAIDQSDANTKILRAAVTYLRLTDGSWKATLTLEYLFDAAWTVLTTTDYFFGQTYSGSSSSGLVELDTGVLTESLSLSVTTTNVSPAGELSATVNYNGNISTTAVPDTVYIPSSGSVINLSHLGFGIKTVDVAGPALPLTSPTLHIDNVTLSGNLTYQSCTESDFGAIDLAIPYALDYLPDFGWSNDFGTTRAMAQLSRKVDVSLFTPTQLALNGTDLVYGPQTLQLLGGANHKYAVLNCESSVVGDKYISVAFRALSGNPKVGLILGYQDTAAERFWAVMVDLAARRISYGMHYIGHNFQVQGWTDIFGADAADWALDWQRLIVRVTGPAPYTVQAWMGSRLQNSSSSGAGARFKTIPVDGDNPIYVVTNKTEWNGSSVSTSQFADGPTGVYAYGGEAAFAELTISPAGQDIVVPDKCPWLNI